MRHTLTTILLILTITTLCFSQSSLETVVHRGHKGWINEVAFSPDGKYMITGSQDNMAKLWEVSSGRELRTFKGHTDWIESVDFSPDGRHIVTGSRDKTARIWDAFSGQLIRQIRGYEQIVFCVSFTPDGQYVAVSPNNNRTDLYEVSSGRRLKTYSGHDYLKGSLCQAFSRDGKFLATGSYDKKVIIWDVQTGAIVQTFKDHTNTINSLDISPDAKWAISSSGAEKAAILWEIQSGKPMWAVHDTLGFYTVRFHPDGRSVLTATSYTLRLFDLQTGKEIWSYDNPGSGYSCGAFSPNGHYLALGRDNSQIQLIDATQVREIRAFEGKAAEITCLEKTSRGDLLAIGRSDGRVQIWDMGSGRIISTMQADSKNVKALCFDKSAKTLYTGGEGGIVKCWDVSTGQILKTFTGHSSWILSIDHSPEEKQMLAGSWDNTAKIWDIESGRVIHTISDHTYPVYARFVDRGRRFITGSSDDTAKLWDTKSGRLLKTYAAKDQWTSGMDISPDGKTLLLGMAKPPNETRPVLRMWDVKSGREIRAIADNTKTISDLKYNPNGKLIASGSNEGLIKIWESSTGQCNLQFMAHSYGISELLFTQGGSTLWTSSIDATARLWDTDSGALNATFISMGESDFVIVLSDHYYMATPGALNGIHFRMGEMNYPFEQFDLRFNRPDIVMSRLGVASPALITAYRQAYLKRLKKMGFTEDQVQGDIHLPEIVILTKNIPPSSTEPPFSFKIRAQDTKYTLDRINLYVNDVPVWGVRGRSIKDLNTKTIERNIKMTLSGGINKIQVSCHNAQGTESLKETIDIFCQGPEIKPDLYILAVGTSQYQDPEFNLDFAASDAQKISGAFKKKEGEFYDEVKVISFIDQEATRENIKNAKRFFQNSHVDDHVILFAAGHGLLTDEMDYYYATHDVDFARPAANGLPYEEFEAILDGIPARKKLFLMDACHSGELDEDDLVVEHAVTEQGAIKTRAVRGFKRISKQKNKSLSLDQKSDLLRMLFADLRRGTGATVITSSSGAQYAYESPAWQGGVFTYAFVDGLQAGHADTDQGTGISVSEIRDHVIWTVSKLTAGKQTPTARRENLADDFRVW